MNVTVTSLSLSFIIAVALATVVMLIIIALTVGLIYYRWRTKELMSGFSYYIRKNLKLEQRIDQLEQELMKQEEKQFT